ncbi:mCG147398 [Mus musculus]|nr:mCG147398 [Mus musculus]
MRESDIYRGSWHWPHSSTPRGLQWRREGCQAPVKKKETVYRPSPS